MGLKAGNCSSSFEVQLDEEEDVTYYLTPGNAPTAVSDVQMLMAMHCDSMSQIVKISEDTLKVNKDVLKVSEEVKQVANALTKYVDRRVEDVREDVSQLRREKNNLEVRVEKLEAEVSLGQATAGPTEPPLNWANIPKYKVPEGYDNEPPNLSGPFQERVDTIARFGGGKTRGERRMCEYCHKDLARSYLRAHKIRWCPVMKMI